MNQRPYTENTKRNKLDSARYNEALLAWLGEHSTLWNVVVTWHVPETMRRHYRGYDEDWLARELTRYFNKVDRRIYKAGLKNRGMRLPRIITLEYNESVGWHAHGLLDCAPGKNEDETLELLTKLWRKHTDRFATDRFEKHLVIGQYDNGKALPYIIKRIDRQNEQAHGILDLNNTYIPD